MPFFEQTKTKNKAKGEAGNSLQTNPNKKQTNLIFNQKKPRTKQKRASFFTSQNEQASLAVEASIAMPIFLCAIYLFLTIIHIVTLQSKIEYALHDTAKEMAISGYIVNKLGVDETDKVMSLFMGATYVKQRVIEQIGEDYLDKSAVKNGASGLHFYCSSILEEDDWIDLVVLYRISPKFQIFPIIETPMVNRCKIHAFTGYAKIGEEIKTEEMVYITKNGEVYHKSLDCSYLKMDKICATCEAGEDITIKGKVYKPCSFCVEPGDEFTGYVTLYGDCYHSSPYCSRIYREIQEVPLSEVGNRRPCSKCY